MRPGLLLLPCLLTVAGPASASSSDGGGDGLVLVIGGVVAAVAVAVAAWMGWRFGRLRGRLALIEAEAARLAAERAGLRAAAERAEAQARLLDSVIAAMTDGVAVVDAGLRLISWNPRFPEVTGVPGDKLRIGMPFEDVVLLQARAGEFGLVDPEAETARRMQLLRQARLLERWQRERPDGSRIELRRAPLPGGGFVTLYTRLDAPAQGPPPALVRAFRDEWRSRVPRLTAAAADADVASVRTTAHAMRGIAANAGWGGAVATLTALEAAAAAGETREVRALAASLVMDEPW